MNSVIQLSNENQMVSKDDLDSLKNSKFKGFTNDEVSSALRICSVLKLNPLFNQIHFVPRVSADGKKTITPQVGIDGFRLIAGRTEKYAGNDDAIFEYKENDKLKEYPIKATTTVYRIIDGVRCPFTASARWDEYYPGGKQGYMWEKMPHTLLGKCSEALALRKAFPAEFLDVRSDEEMQQADSSPKVALEIQKKVEAQKEEPAIETTSKPVEENGEPVSQIPECHGKPMRISKWIDRNFGHKPYWCPECNNKVAAE